MEETGLDGMPTPCEGDDDAAQQVVPNDMELFLAEMLGQSTRMVGEMASALGPDSADDGEPGEEQPQRRQLTEAERRFVEERSAVERVFDDVRGESAEGRLVTTGRWGDLSMAPHGMDADAFAVLVLDTLELAREGKPFEGSGIGEGHNGDDEAPDDVAAAAEADAVHDDVQEDVQESVQSDVRDGAQSDVRDDGQVDGQGDEAQAQLEPPLELERAQEPLACDDIKVVEGKKGVYLYSSDRMSENYAHWSFLAAEDDDILTFVDNVRQESRLYPRPMLASSFKNRPYLWDDERVFQTFAAVRESGDYPDIETCKASNGDVYFYSTDHLSRAQAQALAEWYSVERAMNV